MSSRLTGTGMLVLATATLMLTTRPASATSPASPDQPAAPPARFSAAMAYDAATGTVILFGGLGSGGGCDRGLNDTWAWDGSGWMQLSPATSPPGRSGASMAYDAGTGALVLFGGDVGGGCSTQPANDTWTFDGNTWTQQAPGTSPPVRYNAAMAYDGAGGQIVLFGGDDGQGGSLGDTWTWEGSTWTQQSPATAPSARGRASMAFNAAAGNTVLFGGLNRNGYLDETWIWDGANWTKQAPMTSPHGRDFAALSYDAITSGLVLFGGFYVAPGNPPLPATQNDTWLWDGNTWTQQAPATNPPLADGVSLAYDEATGTAVLFAVPVNTSRVETWTWDGSTWSK